MSRDWINWLWIGLIVSAWGAYSMVTFRHFVMSKKSIGVVRGSISGLFFVAIGSGSGGFLFYALAISLWGTSISESRTTTGGLRMRKFDLAQ